MHIRAHNCSTVIQHPTSTRTTVACVQASMHTCMHARTYTHIHTHARTHTHTHIHTHTIVGRKGTHWDGAFAAKVGARAWTAPWKCSSPPERHGLHHRAVSAMPIEV